MNVLPGFAMWAGVSWKVTVTDCVYGQREDDRIVARSVERLAVEEELKRAPWSCCR